jgi:hypothetical protein
MIAPGQLLEPAPLACEYTSCQGAYAIAHRRDPQENAIESALQPGHFIAWNQESGFVAGLERVEREIAAMVSDDGPLRASRLYEIFIAACFLKADQIDSEWEFGRFIAELACGWIRARQEAEASAESTARTLLSWMDRDDYGFFNDLGSDAAKVLDRPGLAAFEKEVRGRFEEDCKKQKDQSGGYPQNRWAQILRSIYAQKHSVDEYLAVAERTGLTLADCATVASMFEARRKLGDALRWIERGISLEAQHPLGNNAGCNLAGRRRALLKKLGRGQEALECAWAEFEKRPGAFAYDELMRYIPKRDRTGWHENAMKAAERGDLASLVDLLVKVKEAGRLADRLEGASDRELEELSHYTTQPAAKALAQSHPAVAAKVFRALCMRTLKAAKSKYYDAALAHLKEARKCYLAAGFEHKWEGLALEIRRDHLRKSSFMPGFNAIIAGKSAPMEVSFLDRARWRWAAKTKV